MATSSLERGIRECGLNHQNVIMVQGHGVFKLTHTIMMVYE